MNAPHHYDAQGERIEDDDPTPDTTTRTRDQIHSDRCAQLRAILRAARERREAQR